VFTILLLFSAKTLVRNWEWRNTQALAESALKVNWGNAKVQMTMGNVLAQQVCVCVCMCVCVFMCVCVYSVCVYSCVCVFICVCV